MPNAIDCGAFEYDGLLRQKIREELGLSDKYVIGHVGRFHYAKNHEYLLQIFAALCRKGDKDYALLLLGEGGGMEAAGNQAKELGISDKVLFAGNKRNVYDYYQAMDYFVYPSRFEASGDCGGGSDLGVKMPDVGQYLYGGYGDRAGTGYEH